MIRFPADAGLHHAIADGCLRREPAIDFLSAHEARLAGVSDPEVLAFATHQKRILVTSDLRTTPRYFGNFLEANSQCAGVFLVKRRAPAADGLISSLRFFPRTYFITRKSVPASLEMSQITTMLG